MARGIKSPHVSARGKQPIAEDRPRDGHPRELANRLIIQLNTPGDFRECIASLLSAIQSWVGCDAVGLRLKEGFDYPYYETLGFDRDFAEKERHLCSYDANRELLRDASGNPVLECMCGNVIEGRFDPSKPFFTRKGSFISGSTTELLANTSDEDRLTRTRNRCNGAGYESVALVPLRAEGRVYGLLQLNARRMDAYSARMMLEIERMADDIAMAIGGRYALEELLGRERMYRSLFENMLNGFAYCQMLYEDGNPVDFVYLAVNEAFTRQTGLKDVTGKRVSEVIPGIRESDPGLLETYGRIARLGSPERFEIYVQAMAMWFEVSVYNVSQDHFVAVFDVITERKELENRLKRDLEEKEILLREIHHRVKNNLNVISSLLDIQAMEIRSKEDAIEAFSKSRDRIYAMALAHEGLYSGVKGSAKVGMQPYIERLVGDLMQIYKPQAELSIEVAAGALEFDVEFAGPCGLIVNELATNALKYAFAGRDRGALRISMLQGLNGGIELAVSDDGIGLPADARKGSLGLSLVRLLVEQLNGTMEMAAGDGTTFLARFPAKLHSR